jgi:hypothetical protein
MSNEKLSPADVSVIRAIRPRFVLGISSKLATAFGVSKGLISMIQQGKRWRHVKPDPQRAEAFLKCLGKWKDKSND